MQKTFPISIERLAHDGAGQGTFEGKPVRVHGMLVGEEGIVDAHKVRGIFVGTLRELTKASPSRKTPDELHYLSCSPWQVMEYASQTGAKHEMLSALFAFHFDAPKPTMVTADKFYGYRTKVEFSFTDRDGDNTLPLSLAYHERGGTGGRRLALPEGCLLVSEHMNRVALAIAEKLRNLGQTTKELKIGPRYFDYVLGIVKAYTTRVGSGPFPTELSDAVGEHLANKGKEFGSVTGRRRRTGWFDAVALRRSVFNNSVTGLCVTKLDVLDGLDELRICVEYRGKQGVPLGAESFAECEPVYINMPGWKETTFGVTDYAALPANARAYLHKMEELVGVPIDIISTGPDRAQTIMLRHPFDS